MFGIGGTVLYYPNNNAQIRPDHSAIVETEDLAALIKKLKLKS